jgi:hypothetical protein
MVMPAKALRVAALPTMSIHTITKRAVNEQEALKTSTHTVHPARKTV